MRSRICAATSRVVKLSLGYSDGFDGELRISLPKPYLGCFGPEHWKLKSNIHSYNRNWWRRKEICVRNSHKLRGFVNFRHVGQNFTSECYYISEEILNNSHRERVYQVYECLNTCISRWGHHFSTHVNKRRTTSRKIYIDSVRIHINFY